MQFASHIALGAFVLNCHRKLGHQLYDIAVQPGILLKVDFLIITVSEKAPSALNTAQIQYPARRESRTGELQISGLDLPRWMSWGRENHWSHLIWVSYRSTLKALEDIVSRSA